MPSPAARPATARPIAPQPTTPQVRVERRRSGRAASRSQRPSRTERSSTTTPRSTDWLMSTSASPAWAATSSGVRHWSTRSSTSWPSSTARSGSTPSWSQSVITTSAVTPSLPDGTVELLAEDVGVADVAGRLLDHVDQDPAPAQLPALAPGMLDDLVQRGRGGHDLAAAVALGLVEGEDVSGGLAGLDAPVGVRVLLGPGEADLLAVPHPLEPRALHVGQVLDQAEQAGPGGDHGPAQLLVVQALQLPQQGRPVEVEEAGQHLPLAAD